jgi:hypothetical protein
MRRGEAQFELQEKVDQGIETEGSNLSGVNSKCSWEEPGENDRDNLYDKDGFDDDEDDAERGHLSILGMINRFRQLHLVELCHCDNNFKV